MIRRCNSTKKARRPKTHSKVRKTMTLNNIANLYYLKKNYKKAVELWRQAFERSPELEFVQFRLALALAKSGDLIKASSHLDTLLGKRPERSDYNFLKGSILLKQQRYDPALSFFRRVLKQNSGSVKALVKTGVALNLMEEYQRAEMFLKDAHARDPEDSSTLLWLVATNLALADTADADRYLNILIASVPINQLKSILDRIADPDTNISARRKLLNPVINSKLRDKFEALTLPGDDTGYVVYSDISKRDGF